MTTANSITPRNVDELVATYAPIGARRKRRVRARRIGLISGATAIAALFAALTLFGVSISDSVLRLMPQRTAQIDPAHALQQAKVAERLAELETHIFRVQQQEQELSAQRVAVEEQGRQLAQLLAQTDSEQLKLQLRKEQGSQLDIEIAAISAQREALEKRWAQFEAQGELLAMEIIAVNAQRKELEAQRLQIDSQRRELDDLLDRAATMTQSTDPTSASDEESFTYTYNSLMVDNSELDQMRGGFSVGDGLDVSFGFEQIGSINGVEQFSNSFTIDSVGSGFDNVDMSNMNSVILQNGNGNFVSSSVLDTLSDSFGNIIQNSLDDQVISTTTTYDIGLQNVSGTLQGLAGEQALLDSLTSFR